VNDTPAGERKGVGISAITGQAGCGVNALSVVREVVGQTPDSEGQSYDHHRHSTDCRRGAVAMRMVRAKLSYLQETVLYKMDHGEDA
jgi:hypothetical protein